MTDPLSRLCRKATLRVAGLMSGTSADGVDVAVVDIARRGGVKVLAHDTFAYPPPLRRAILALCRPETSRLDDICHFNFALAEVFADAVARLARRARIPLASIDLIGSHGQTICHNPQGRRFGRRIVRSTLQIGEPSVIAERTGITTVADFRPRDVAAGGQGAPLVPFADFAIFSHPRLHRAVQNIGGIANLTYLPAGGDPSRVLAFDTGPGNMIMDRLAWRLTAGRLNYDRGGKIAAAGHINRRLLAEWMRHPFLARRPPKSTGREDFGTQFTDRLHARARRRGLSGPDLMATAAAFTAATIAGACGRYLPGPLDEMILCGGGARNPMLVGMLTALMHPAAVRTTDEFGIDADAKEAISFAILAERTIRAQPANVPSATGARHPAILGKIILGNNPC